MTGGGYEGRWDGVAIEKEMEGQRRLVHTRYTLVTHLTHTDTDNANLWGSNV